MSKNNNVNQNAIQIIFPSDMELRKVKKKRKSASSSKKKELIAELKELLQTYDSEIAIAQEKKVTLPADLGELPKNINQVRSVKQLELLIDEIKSKILKIQELIRNATTSGRANELFGVAPRPQGIGAFPMLIPPQTPAPVQPQIIQPPQILPSRIIPVRPANNVGQKLDALEAEILKNLDPNDPATKNIIDQINKRKAEEANKPPVVVPGTVVPGTVVPGIPVTPGQPIVTPGQPIVTPGQPIVTPGQPVRPTPPTPISEDLKLETQKGDLIGITGKRLTVTAPISNESWFQINDAFRRYAENVEFSAQQLRPGEYHIPIDNLNEANQTRQKLIMRYNEWLGNLSTAQRNYIDTNQLLRSANQQMFNQLNESPDE